MSDKPEITQGILFRKEFKIRSEAFAKSMGRTRVVRGTVTGLGLKNIHK